MRPHENGGIALEGLLELRTAEIALKHLSDNCGDDIVAWNRANYLSFTLTHAIVTATQFARSNADSEFAPVHCHDVSISLIVGALESLRDAPSHANSLEQLLARSMLNEYDLAR